MKTIISYLDDLKEKCGSDYKAAKLLKTNQSTISNIRTRNQCGEDTAIKIADLLGVTREEVLIAAAIARSNSEEAKHAWENISKLTGIAASVVLSCILTTNDAGAAGFSNIQNNDMLYIMRINDSSIPVAKKHAKLPFTKQYTST
jgi:plasmid maintenance system antidote protein VapI